MKNSIFRNLAVAFAAVMLLLCLPLTAYAADATVNGEDVSKGDTVTLEVFLGDVKDPLEGVGAYIKYDTSSLEYVDGSIGFDVLNNAMYNIEPGKIYYSAIDVINGFDLSEEKMMVKLSFKVLDGAKGDLTIEHTYDEIFTLVNEEEDLTDKDYSARSITTVNTYTVNDAPNPGYDANLLEEYQKSSETDFDNVMLGTDKEELIASAASAASASSVDASDSSASPASSSAADVSYAQQTVSSESAPSKNNSVTVVVIVAAVFVLLLVVAIVISILSKNKTKD